MMNDQARNLRARVRGATVQSKSSTNDRRHKWKSVVLEIQHCIKFVSITLYHNIGKRNYYLI